MLCFSRRRRHLCHQNKWTRARDLVQWFRNLPHKHKDLSSILCTKKKQECKINEPDIYVKRKNSVQDIIFPPFPGCPNSPPLTEAHTSHSFSQRILMPKITADIWPSEESNMNLLASSTECNIHKGKYFGFTDYVVKLQVSNIVRLPEYLS